MRADSTGGVTTLHVVLPTLNRRDSLCRCLDALRAQSLGPASVTVIDSGSTDGTLDALRDRFPEVVLLQRSGSTWWTGAVVAGIEHVLGRLAPADLAGAAVVLLNDDLELPPDLLEHLAHAAREHPDTLVGALVLDAADTAFITHGGCRIGWWTASWRELHRGRSVSDFDSGHTECPDALSGRGVLVPLPVFARAGLPNAVRLPQHGDNEFTIRAKRAGFELLTSYDARVWCDFAHGTDLNRRPLSGLADFRAVLTSLRSYVNVRERFAFAVLTRVNLPQLACYLCSDAARVAMSLWRRRVQRSAHAD